MIIYVYDSDTVMRTNDEILDGWAKIEMGYSCFDSESLFSDYLNENYGCMDIFNMDEDEKEDTRQDFFDSLYKDILHWLNTDCTEVEVLPAHGCDFSERGFRWACGA